MTAWRQQVLIDAPLDVVWSLVGDPRRFPDWAGNVVEVTGLAEVSVGAQFQQKSRMLGGSEETTFVIEELEDLHEIRLRCLTSGFYTYWLLTEAGESTFADAEIGMDPVSSRYRAVNAVVGKRYYRRLLNDVLGSLREVATRELAAGGRAVPARPPGASAQRRARPPRAVRGRTPRGMRRAWPPRRWPTPRARCRGSVPRWSAGSASASSPS